MLGWMIIGLVIIIGVVALAFLIWGLKKAFKLLINSLIGFFALWLTQQLFVSTLIINIWSVLITAIFGIICYVVVLVMHFLGIWF